jgi:hypothetical protein
MTGAATPAQQIEALIVRLDGAAICDGCIAERLDIAMPAQVNVVMRTLAGQSRYERKRAPCALCGTTRLVIRQSGK